MKLHRHILACAALALGLLVGFTVGPVAATAGSEAVVLDSRRYPILAGRFSEFARFQHALRTAIEECGRSRDLPSDFDATGRIGKSTEAAIRVFTECRGEQEFPSSSMAREGVLTAGVWTAVMGEVPIPDVEMRSHALVLSFEGTDFGDAPEWNLCQDGTRQGPRGPVTCFNSSDPCSYVTWGPRGATAGSGREIQYILAEVERRNPALLRRAFGSEYPTLSRLFRAKSGQRNGCSGNIPLKILVCSVWVTPERRAIWERALAELGKNVEVREIYDKLYAAEEFDGGKMRAFFGLWAAIGLKPSEVDLAFFLDRITHLGGPPEQSGIAERLQTCMRGEKALSKHGAARRCLSRLQTHTTQPDYRAARDVAFYLDAYNEGVIDARELKLWAGYMPLSAVHNFGLRDDRSVEMPKTAALTALGMQLPPEAEGQVLPSEVARCPAAVLSPRPAP